MNIIVLGCGKAGQKIAELLNEENGHNITLIDRRYDVVNDIINHFDIMGVVGDGADVDVLKEAGIETADLLIAVTGSDELNLLASLMAKKLGNCRSIARVRRPEGCKPYERRFGSFYGNKSRTRGGKRNCKNTAFSHRYPD